MIYEYTKTNKIYIRIDRLLKENKTYIALSFFFQNPQYTSSITPPLILHLFGHQGKGMLNSLKVI